MHSHERLLVFSVLFVFIKFTLYSLNLHSYRTSAAELLNVSLSLSFDIRVKTLRSWV